MVSVGIPQRNERTNDRRTHGEIATDLESGGDMKRKTKYIAEQFLLPLTWETYEERPVVSPCHESLADAQAEKDRLAKTFNKPPISMIVASSIKKTGKHSW